MTDLIQYFTDNPPIEIVVSPYTVTTQAQTPFASFSAAGTSSYAWRTTTVSHTTTTTEYHRDVKINPSFWVLVLLILSAWFLSHMVRRAFR
jgi:hypothetical protein